MMLRKNAALFLKKILPAKAYGKLRGAWRSAARMICYRIWFPAVYRLHAGRPVKENRVLFVELHDQKGISDNYQLIWEELSEHYDYDLELFTLNKPKRNNYAYYRRCAALAARAAEARVIFVDDALQVFGHIPFRKETGIYNVWHACGAFKRFGFGTAELLFGNDRKTQERYPNYTFCTEFYVSAPEVIRPYAESTGLPEEKVIALGTSRTDFFFRDSFRAAAEEKLHFLFPASRGKKVILYAPTFRGRVASAKGATALSIPMFYEALSDEYVLIFKYHPFVKSPPAIPQQYQDFAVNFTGIMSIEELLCTADICITDYSSLIFEYALFARPMLFFAYDLEIYDDWRGFYYDYDELTPGPVFRRNGEMIDYILHIGERFDPQQVADFRSRFMSACDGKVTERLIARVFGEELASHRLPAAGESRAAGPPESAGDRPGDEAAKGKKRAAGSPESAGAGPEDEAAKEETRAAGSPGSAGAGPEDETAKEETRAAFAEAAARKEAIRQDVNARFPAAQGKRIAAYFMKGETFHSSPPCRPYADWIELMETIPEDLVVLYRYWGRRKDAVPAFDCSLFCNCRNRYSREEMAAAADDLITHCDADVVRYSDGKPVYVFIPEYRWYCSSAAEYEASTAYLREAGIWCETTEELVEALRRPYPPVDREQLTLAVRQLETIYTKAR